MTNYRQVIVIHTYLRSFYFSPADPSVAGIIFYESLHFLEEGEKIAYQQQEGGIMEEFGDVRNMASHPPVAKPIIWDRPRW